MVAVRATFGWFTGSPQSLVKGAQEADRHQRSGCTNGRVACWRKCRN